MKTLILILALFVSNKTFSQIYLVVEPVHGQPGVAYNQNFSRTFGMYAKGRYGLVNHRGFQSTQHYVTSFKCTQAKISAGVSFKPWGNSHNSEMPRTSGFIVGINYTHFFNIVDHSELISLKKADKISFDLGVISDIDDHLSVYFCTDFLEWESELGIGYRF